MQSKKTSKFSIKITADFSVIFVVNFTFTRFSIVLTISFDLENETPCGSAGISAGRISQASFSGCKGV